MRFDEDTQVLTFLTQLAATQAGRMERASLGGPQQPSAKPLFHKAAAAGLQGAAGTAASARGVRGGVVTLKLWRAVSGAPDSMRKGSVGHGVCDHLTR